MKQNIHDLYICESVTNAFNSIPHLDSHQEVDRLVNKLHMHLYQLERLVELGYINDNYGAKMLEKIEVLRESVEQQHSLNHLYSNPGLLSRSIFEFNSLVAKIDENGNTKKAPMKKA